MRIFTNILKYKMHNKINTYAVANMAVDKAMHCYHIKAA